MATPSDVKKRTRLQPDQRRGRIVETSLGAFARLGLDATMTELAEAAGVTRPAIYHYFPGKLELFLEVAEAQSTELLRYIAPVAFTDDDDRDHLRAIGDAILRFAEEHPQGWRVLFEHLEADTPALADIRARVHEVAMAGVYDGQCILVPATLSHATEALRDRLVPQLVSGEVAFAFATTEPAANGSAGRAQAEVCPELI